MYCCTVYCFALEDFRNSDSSLAEGKDKLRGFQVPTIEGAEKVILMIIVIRNLFSLNILLD